MVLFVIIYKNEKGLVLSFKSLLEVKMKNKFLLFIMLIVMLFGFTGCKKDDALLFKENYESMNNQVNKNGKEHRSVTINEKNPFIMSSAKECWKK